LHYVISSFLPRTRDRNTLIIICFNELLLRVSQFSLGKAINHEARGVIFWLGAIENASATRC
jgi:hypothetical protein